MLYSRAYCSWCMDAKEWLDKNHFEYEAIDIGTDAEAANEMVRISGQQRVPTIVVNGEVLADFGTPELEAFMKAKGHV